MRIATLGYALPGSVLAVGVMLAFIGIDNFLRSVLQAVNLDFQGQLLSGSLAALLLAYLLRFLAVAFGPVDSGLEHIRPSLSEAARSLGSGQREVLRRVYLCRRLSRFPFPSCGSSVGARAPCHHR